MSPDLPRTFLFTVLGYESSEVGLHVCAFYRGAVLGANSAVVMLLSPVCVARVEVLHAVRCCIGCKSWCPAGGLRTGTLTKDLSAFHLLCGEVL